MISNDKILFLIEKFISGEDISISSANKIESALDDAFGEDDEVQDVVLMLASYRPEGGDYLYNSEDVKILLKKIIPKLS